MPDAIYFPLRTNASSLAAGPSASAVRRRILAAGLLHETVVLEQGIHVAWAGPAGASEWTSHSPMPHRWQLLKARGDAGRRTHYFAVTPAGSTERHVLVSTPVEFSWEATFEPFRAEAPASATWLAFGYPTDDRPIKQVVAEWQQAARLAGFAAGRSEPTFVEGALLSAGYYDLATSAVSGYGVSIDRRHRVAIDRSVREGGAHRLPGHAALAVLLPSDVSWADVSELRTMRGIRDYRRILAEAEDAALDSATSVEDFERLVNTKYAGALAKAASRGPSLSARMGFALVSFVVGEAAGVAAPFVGGAAASAASFTAGEAIGRAMHPRWLAIDRRMRGGQNGL